MSKAYDVHLAPAAVRIFEKLPVATRAGIRKSLEQLASDVSQPGRVRGKRVKSIRGTADSFHRLRVGDYRIMFDVIGEDRVLLVLGIVHRGDLERWLRSR